MKKPRWQAIIGLTKLKQPLNQRGETMVQQTVLPFKLEMTKDIITAHAGLGLLGEFAAGLKLLELTGRYLPEPGSGAGYKAHEYIFPLILMLNGGGRSLEDLRQIREDWEPCQNGHIAETVHCMNKTRKAFRLIVIRRSSQKEMFAYEDTGKKYTAVASNKTESAEEIIEWYNQRGECSENRIKDLKIGFGMERMPCGQFEANAVFFRIGVMAYNTYKLFVLHALDRSWHKHQA